METDVLLVKLNATGDVVRTTTLLQKLPGEVTWITAGINTELLTGIRGVRCLSWDAREAARDRSYSLVINLEDEAETAAFVGQLEYAQLFGAYLKGDDSVAYTDDSRQWFDMSLISAHGRRRADRLKRRNRRTYQDLIFSALGWSFAGEPYLIQSPAETALRGDVAIAPVAGPVWPMKGWAFYAQLRQALEATGLRVNILPRRPTLLEHMGDVKNHRCLVGGDSLPMHLALATATPCVTIFNCTSPWEIHDYGLQTKIVSPLLGRYFYQRGHDVSATTAVAMPEVYEAVTRTLQRPVVPHSLVEQSS